MSITEIREAADVLENATRTNPDVVRTVLAGRGVPVRRRTWRAWLLLAATFLAGGASGFGFGHTRAATQAEAKIRETAYQLYYPVLTRAEYDRSVERVARANQTSELDAILESIGIIDRAPFTWGATPAGSLK